MPKIHNITIFWSKTYPHALAHMSASARECMYSVTRLRVCTSIDIHFKFRKGRALSDNIYSSWINHKTIKSARKRPSVWLCLLISIHGGLLIALRPSCIFVVKMNKTNHVVWKDIVFCVSRNEKKWFSYLSRALVDK